MVHFVGENYCHFNSTECLKHAKAKLSYVVRLLYLRRALVSSFQNTEINFHPMLFVTTRWRAPHCCPACWKPFLPTGRCLFPSNSLRYLTWCWRTRPKVGVQIDGGNNSGLHSKHIVPKTPPQNPVAMLIFSPHAGRCWRLFHDVFYSFIDRTLFSVSLTFRSCVPKIQM